MPYLHRLAIWADEDLSGLALTLLGYEADQGQAICTSATVTHVTDPAEVPADAAAFLNLDPVETDRLNEAKLIVLDDGASYAGSATIVKVTADGMHLLQEGTPLDRLDPAHVTVVSEINAAEVGS